ncbi:MAG: hypothetical protein HOW73_08050 [Polyangiaceae bacterium]|nr:hypothetical protein [Polyangiaceae bacterium]
MKKALSFALASLTLLACASPPAIGYEPQTTPAERDELHRTTPIPATASIDELTSTTVTAVFDVPQEYMTAWFTELPLDKALPGTDELPGVARTEPLTEGPWGVKGARRRVVLKDDSTALEQIVEVELPNRVQYVVWNYTSDAAKYVEYGIGEFRFVRAGDKTEVHWTYAFSARGWPASWFLGGFVDGDYRDMMTKSLGAMKRLAEEGWRRRTEQKG